MMFERFLCGKEVVFYVFFCGALYPQHRDRNPAKRDGFASERDHKTSSANRSRKEYLVIQSAALVKEACWNQII